jgi:Protein of unknown function (DUF1570)
VIDWQEVFVQTLGKEILAISPTLQIRALLSVIAALLAALAPARLLVAAEDFADRHADLRSAYARQLADLAGWADDQQLLAEAQRTRDWLPAPEAMRLTLACRPAPDEMPVEPPEDLAERWRDRFSKLRRAQADALFDLARAASAGGQASASFHILPEVIRENPHHAKARAILGYEEFAGRWLTPFEIAKARDRQVWHQRFGWLPADRVSRYEAGERFYGGRWMSAEDEQRLGARKGWDIATEHYTVHTTTGLEEGVRLAMRLERLHDAWQQMFAGFSASEALLARRFAGQGASPGMPARHKVVYYGSRDEYVRAIEKDEPNIALTAGYYLAARRTAYFFADGEEDYSTVYHEATHQLFNEVRHAMPRVGADANFWVVEGIACYMESLESSHGWHRLGGENAARLRDAVHRLLVSNYYVPIAELTGYGMERLKHDPNMPMLYSQSSGLTYFLMHGEAGRYRGPLVAYLSAIYQGHDRPDTLAELSGATNSELDAQYRSFIESVK